MEVTPPMTPHCTCNLENVMSRMNADKTQKRHGCYGMPRSSRRTS